MKKTLLAVTLMFVGSLAFAGNYKVIKVEKEIPGLDHYHILKCSDGKKREVLENPKKNEFWFGGKKFSNLSGAANYACK